jgi:hypothetical protein
VSRRALLSLAILFTTACGQVVKIGSEGEIPTPPPAPDAGLGLACGDGCALDTTCTANGCPPSAGGSCDVDGHCTINTPVCPGPDVDPRCAGATCGKPCDACDPVNPNCATSIDAGPGSPPLFCDAKQQCQPGPITCP